MTIEFKFPRPRRREKRMSKEHRQKCVDHYVVTHSIQELAGMLVDLEWREGHEPVIG
jgi:hypothetical protein